MIPRKKQELPITLSFMEIIFLTQSLKKKGAKTMTFNRKLYQIYREIEKAEIVTQLRE